jgi:hypothetical protein
VTALGPAEVFLREEPSTLQSTLQRSLPLTGAWPTHAVRHQAFIALGDGRRSGMTAVRGTAVVGLSRCRSARANDRSVIARLHGADPSATSAALNSSPSSGRSDACRSLDGVPAAAGTEVGGPVSDGETAHGLTPCRLTTGDPSCRSSAGRPERVSHRSPTLAYDAVAPPSECRH